MKKIHTPLPLERWAEFPRLRPRKQPPEGMVLREEDLERFWSKVKIGSPDECWEWQASGNHGYGCFCVLGVNLRAHRCAMYFSGMPIPEGMHACHKCDNRLCCNPSHLFAGSNQDNMVDALNKRRLKQVVLSPVVVQDMKRQRSNGVTFAEMGRKYGISHTAARYAVCGVTWKSVRKEICE